MKPSALKEIESLDRNVGMRIVAKLEAMADEPRPRGIAKLQGAVDLWRVRIGDYRVIFTINDREQTIEVFRVAHRSEVYNW